jgi:hypothetical protein
MLVDHIRYDLLAQEALRGVVRRVLTDAAANGLPGEHHFLITFDTTAEGVELSSRMRAQYPAEMMIVLQYQFWDLAVSEERFEVGLSFGGIAEKLAIPFAAIKSFVDPSAKFGLRFSEVEEDASGAEEPITATPPAKDRDSAPVPPTAVPPQPEAAPLPPAPALATTKPGPVPAAAAAKPADKAPPGPDDGPDKPSGGSGDVVRFDRFRKKK